jgi:hypothetical protein
VSSRGDIVSNSKAIQRPYRVGWQVVRGPCRGPLGAAFDHQRGVARVLEGSGQAQSGDATANDDDASLCSCRRSVADHDVSHQLSLLSCTSSRHARTSASPTEISPTDYPGRGSRPGSEMCSWLTGLRTRRCNPKRLGTGSGLAPRRHAQLGQNLGDMAVDGMHRQHKLRCDLPIGQATS